MSEELYTVEAAAGRLKLHPKTVLRFIREKRLRATRIGKQYRILRSDLDALTGAAAGNASTTARATTIVDISGVDQELLRRLTSTLTGAAGSRDTLSVDLAYDPARRSLKVILVGSPGDVATLLTLVDVCMEA